MKKKNTCGKPPKRDPINKDGTKPQWQGKTNSNQFPCVFPLVVKKDIIQDYRGGSSLHMEHLAQVHRLTCKGAYTRIPGLMA